MKLSVLYLKNNIVYLFISEVPSPVKRYLYRPLGYVGPSVVVLIPKVLPAGLNSDTRAAIVTPNTRLGANPADLTCQTLDISSK